MRIYTYGDFGEYRGFTDLNESDKDPKNKNKYLIPGHSTTTPIPEEKLPEYSTWVWNGKRWESKCDYIGVPYYDKKGISSDCKPVEKLGEEIDFEKYTLKEPDFDKLGSYYKFDEILDDWVIDEEAKEIAEKEKRIEDIINTLKELDIKKMRYLLEKDKGDLSGKVYFDEYEAETIRLREELNNLNE